MKVIAQQSIPKIDEITAPMTVLLRENDDGTYSTHIRNDQNGGLLHGSYQLTLPEAWEDFGRRILDNWPILNGEYAPPEKEAPVPIENPKNKLLQPKEIVIVRVEGPIERVAVPAGRPVRVKSWDEANRVIKEIARTAPDDGCYDKTDFKITFEDGFVYTGRYDVTYSDVSKPEPLRMHVREFVKFLCGQYRPKHTYGEGEASYKKLMQQYEQDGTAEEARQFLDRYDVGQ